MMIRGRIIIGSVRGRGGMIAAAGFVYHEYCRGEGDEEKDSDGVWLVGLLGRGGRGGGGLFDGERLTP